MVSGEWMAQTSRKRVNEKLPMYLSCIVKKSRKTGEPKDKDGITLHLRKMRMFMNARGF